MPRPYLFISFISLIAGLIVGQYWHIPAVLAGGLCLLALAGCRWNRGRIIGIIVLCLTIGVWRTSAMINIKANDIANYVGKKITVTGPIVQPPSHAYDKQQIELTQIRSGQNKLAGKIYTSLSILPAYKVGDQLTIECQVTELTATSRWRYWSRGIHARCFADGAKKTGTENNYRVVLGRWQERVMEFGRQNFNEPQASLFNGVLVGNTDGMPDDVQQAFQTTGTTHIVALSGFNVTIIISIISAWLIKMLGRRRAWLPALMIVGIFVVMTGASASVVRAATMASLVNLAIFFGRPIAPERLLIYAAALMLVVNPLILLHDLGFQLSFLAASGLIFLSKPLGQWLAWLPEKLSIRDNLATTLSAIIITEPLLLWQFSRISLIAPLVNILVLPLIPLSMLLGAICLIGIFIPVVNQLIVPPTDAILRLVIFIITSGASLPNAIVQLTTIVTIISGTIFFGLSIILMRKYVAENYTI